MRLFKIATLIVFSLTSASAIAGAKLNLPVQINTTSKSAYGSLTSTRAASDADYQFIGCSFDAAPPSASAVSITCSAYITSTRQLVQCKSTNQAFVPVVKMINKSSYVFFSWDDYEQCTRIYVRNGSQFLP